MKSRPAHRVVALAYDQLCTFEFGCTVEVFALERPELEVDWYRFDVCAAEPGKLRAAGGITIDAPYTLRLLDLADTIIIPGWRGADQAPPEALLKKIRAAYQRGARLCTICSGVFVLAAAGILDGKTVTTHWRYVDKLSQRYPQLTVNPDALYIDEGQIITSAGSAAGLDMLLHLVRKDYGVKVANQVAQRLVIPPHREGGQAQFVPRPVASDERGRLSQLLDDLRRYPAAPHSLASMADKAAMSERSLQRHFVELTGFTPYDWLIRERVACAKDLLESSEHSLARISELSGFGSEESFRRHFRRITSTSPNHYRKQFATKSA
ncbi:transcriptional regulator FtrA [Undibacterium sp. LX40W]|uniref:Transcriptional regulator FtrA n=1 Tax=Undibacterium nitidum TaxID=2762298 RepID=A0A923HLR3_9BURK|nr:MULTISPECIES: transcriptional regulator FtrA [Undibacterium]MBC3881965.1 transcriptional regulator FtrA [Undibacterium nitidum]MBC3892039.1 transcriptional regulator FtrA [Undibacterium sp. LX40W]